MTDLEQYQAGKEKSIEEAWLSARILFALTVAAAIVMFLSGCAR